MFTLFNISDVGIFVFFARFRSFSGGRKILNELFKLLITAVVPKFSIDKVDPLIS